VLSLKERRLGVGRIHFQKLVQFHKGGIKTIEFNLDLEDLPECLGSRALILDIQSIQFLLEFGHGFMPLLPRLEHIVVPILAHLFRQGVSRL